MVARQGLACLVCTGDTTKATDPYFPFEDAVDVWGRTFAALGITYQGSVMTLDLCDRQGKYSNGFCHWPQVRGGAASAYVCFLVLRMPVLQACNWCDDLPNLLHGASCMGQAGQPST